MAETIEASDRIANPWVLGLYALAGATFVVGTRMAGWYGGEATAHLLAPFVAVFGVAQLLAAMWAYERRDDLATAMLGIWGVFWLGYGFLNTTFMSSTPIPAASSALAFWFIVPAAISWMGALAATARGWALVLGLVALAAAATIGAIGEGIGIHGLQLLAGWLFALAGVVSWYAATALMLAASHGREMLPLGRSRPVVPPPAAADIPRTVPTARRVS